MLLSKKKNYFCVSDFLYALSAYSQFQKLQNLIMAIEGKINAKRNSFLNILSSTFFFLLELFSDILHIF